MPTSPYSFSVGDDRYEVRSLHDGMTLHYAVFKNGVRLTKNAQLSGDVLADMKTLRGVDAFAQFCAEIEQHIRAGTFHNFCR